MDPLELVVVDPELLDPIPVVHFLLKTQTAPPTKLETKSRARRIPASPTAIIIKLPSLSRERTHPEGAVS